ncbi:MAG: methyltransferase domain-containing protein [Actinomycetota bacterium]|nr:methyltransferase domain-containing protein [Actinomycetota bacterium]
MSNAEMWNERYRGTDSLWIGDADRSLVEAISGIEVGSAVDIGAGEGRNSVLLARNGWSTTAVDFSEVALTRLQQVIDRENLTAKTVLMDVNEYLEVPEVFDLSVMANMHPPIDQRRRLYEGLLRSTRNGGHIFITGHHKESLGFAGPANIEMLIDEDEVREAFGDSVEYLRLEKVVDVADHGHSAPNLVAFLKRR